nr:MAG TPA: hypothetical protein [Caudoviricetes sp.]
MLSALILLGFWRSQPITNFVLIGYFIVFSPLHLFLISKVFFISLSAHFHVQINYRVLFIIYIIYADNIHH